MNYLQDEIQICISIPKHEADMYGFEDLDSDDENPITQMVENIVKQIEEKLPHSYVRVLETSTYQYIKENEERYESQKSLEKAVINAERRLSINSETRPTNTEISDFINKEYHYVQQYDRIKPADVARIKNKLFNKENEDNENMFLTSSDTKANFNSLINKLLKVAPTPFTFEEFHNNPLKKYELPNMKAGIYLAIKPENLEFTELLEAPDGPIKYMDKDITLKDKFRQKFESKNYNDKIVYIGKANGKNGLKRRIQSYIQFHYEEGYTEVRHYGGYNILFLKDSKKLLLTYLTLENIKEAQPEFFNKAMQIKENLRLDDLAEILEAGLLELHKLNYNENLPLTNTADSKLDLRKNWRKYWLNFN